MNGKGRAGLCLRVVAAVLCAACLAACSGCGERDEIVPLKESICGFYPGEKMDDLFDRARGMVSWREIPNARGDYRGELYIFDSPLARCPGVDHVRLSFIDKRLMEIILYYKQTNVTQLMFLKNRLERQYSTKSTSPDGTTEMAYKTYWLKAPGMSITIRRITKRPETELYVQYLHDQLHEKLKRMKSEKSGG